MIVIDSSALIKPLITEKNSEHAIEIFESATSKGEQLLAPDIIFSETMNGLWKHNVLLKDINDKKLEIARESLVLVYADLEISKATELAEKAIKIGMKHKITFYDSLYVALSISAGAQLFTFDKYLINKAKEIGFDVFCEPDTNSP